MSNAQERQTALRIAAGLDDEPAAPVPRSVWKFGAHNWPPPPGDIPVAAEPEMAIRATVPEGSRFLAASEQRGVPCVWLDVPLMRGGGSPKDARVRLFQLFMTGQMVPPGAVYRGTIVMRGGGLNEHLVVHVFEIDPPADDAGPRS